MKTNRNRMGSATSSFRLDSDFTPQSGGAGAIALTLYNLGDRPIANFRLALTSLFRVKTGSKFAGGTIVEQMSNYHVIAPPEGFTLEPAAAWSMSADQLSHPLTHYNFGPKSAYLILADGALVPVAVSAMTRGGRAGEPRLERQPRETLPADSPPLAIVPFPSDVIVSGKRDPLPVLSFAGGPPEAAAAFESAAALAGRLFPAEPPLFAAGGGIGCTAQKEEMAPEAYRIRFETGSVMVLASHQTGFLYGFITLGQILRGARLAPTEFVFPLGGEIVDGPHFGWRGMMLDVARQVFSVDDLRWFLDRLAWLKLNRFHLHLTDDEGWRLDIPGYPALAERAGWRGHGLPVPPLLGGPSARHGLVYGRAELMSFTRDAATMGVTVVPEVDVPGHSFALLQAIPALRDPQESGTYESVQYFPNAALNPARAEVYDFIEAALGEVADIFPSRWIHVGGDEVAEGAWLGSPLARALMKERGWSEVHELQSHFLQRMQRIVRDLGRRTGAWEEAALGGGIDSTDSYLIAWRKSASGIMLAEQGYDVVLAPAEAYYLDMAQSEDWWEPGLSWAGTVSPEATYAYEPGGDWPDAAKPHLLGVQANLWGEHLHDHRLVDHMTFPRLAAVAESGWTPAGRKDFRRFAAIYPLLFADSPRP